MMVQSATIRNEGWIQKGSKAAEGSMVPLTHDREAVSDQERCSHSHSGLISTLRHKAAAIRNDLTATGGAHVGQDSEFNVALSGEGQHGLRADDHFRGEIRTGLIEYASPTIQNVKSVSPVDVGRGAWRAHRVLLGAERGHIYSWQTQ
jgi:hypothetical protein